MVLLRYQLHLLRDLPDKLPMPAAIDGFKAFKIFSIFSGDIPENSKFKILNLILS